MWTYSGDPRSSTLDQVRFLVGDTDATKSWTLQDGEIQYALSQTSSVLLAAAIAAESIIAKFKGSLTTSKKVGDLAITWDSKALEYYQATAYRLRQRATIAGVIPYAGGTSKSEKAALDADLDRVQPESKIEGMSKHQNNSEDYF